MSLLHTSTQRRLNLESEHPRISHQSGRLIVGLSKSKEFLTWMKATHPNIIVIFVPGNCTCIFQPLDVGIQCVLKLSIKHSAERNAVTEVIHQMDEANELDEAGPIKLDTSVATLRNRSLHWIVQAFHDINKPELVKKVHAPYPLID